MVYGSGQPISSLISGRTPATPYNDLAVACYSPGFTPAHPQYLHDTHNQEACMTRLAVVSINLLALQQNLQIVHCAAPGPRLRAMVKVNTYDHGVACVWGALSGADGPTPPSLEEAILLHEQGWKDSTLLLEGFSHTDEPVVLGQYCLATSVHSNWRIGVPQQAKLCAPLDIYLKVNNGMNRLGSVSEWVHTVWQWLWAISSAGEMALMSYFTEAESPQGIVGPMCRIEQVAEGLNYPRLLANSAATLRHPGAHFG